MDFAFPDEIPEFWFNNNALLTMLLTALSSAFPDGERQFIHSVRNYQDKISDPILLKQVRAFIGQEAHHGKEHDALNAMMLKKGYPVARIYKRFKKDEPYVAATVFFRTSVSLHGMYGTPHSNFS